MEFRHLQSFAAVAQRLSFTKAAQSLGLTQPAVSQHVATLEASLGVSLFQRDGRTVVLTDEGRRLHDYARQILRLVDEAEREVGQTELEIAGTMRIASSTVPAELILPKLLAEFRRLQEGVRETVQVSDSQAAADAVESGEADLGFVGELPRSSKLCARAIVTDKLVLVVSPEHELAKCKRISARRFCATPLIMREPGSGSRRCLEYALESAGLAPDELNVTMEVNTNDAIRATVEGGLGAAFLSEATVARDVEAGRLVIVPVTGVRPQRKLYVVTNPKQLPNSTVREFLEFASEQRSVSPR